MLGMMEQTERILQPKGPDQCMAGESRWHLWMVMWNTGLTDFKFTLKKVIQRARIQTTAFSINMVTQSTRLVCRVVTVGLGFLLLIGCQQKLGGNLSHDAKQLERAFALTSTSPQAGDPSTYKTADTAALVKTLTVALHSGDLDTAAKTLHTLNFRGAGLSF